MRQYLIAASALLLAATLGCRDRSNNETGGVADTTTQPVSATPAAPEAPPAPADFTFEDRQSFSESIRQQLSGIDQQIADLAAQAKSRGGAVSDRALANIRAARRSVDRSLGRVEASTTANWEQVKQGVTQAVENLSEAIEVAQPK
jgi:hypothetical protein